MAKVKVTDNGYSIESLYKWDTGQVLEIYGMTLPVVPQVHFAHKGAQYAIVREATVDASGVIRASIPDSLLQSSANLFAYVCTMQDDEFKTHCKIVIPVITRAKPNDYAPDEEAYVYALQATGLEVVTIEPDADGKVEKILVDDKMVLRFSIPRAPVPRLQIGSVDTLDHTQKATASVTGTAENPILNLGIPMGEPAYADMEESDPAAPGFVKNRTHWRDFELGETIIDKNLPALVFKTETTTSGMVADALVEGRTYHVTWNAFGVVECTCVCGLTAAGQPYIGNPALNDTTAKAADYPFCIVGLGGDSYKVIRSTINNQFYVKLQEVLKDEWHKLDRRFLPDDIGGASSWNDLTDKPFGMVVGELLPETTVEVDENGEARVADILDVKEGSTYTVNWNGVEYNCTAVPSPAPDVLPGVFLGNLGAALGGESSGEPFVILCLPVDYAAVFNAGCAITVLDGSESVTLSISGEMVKKVDEVFLPERNDPLMVKLTFKNYVDGYAGVQLRTYTADKTLEEVTAAVSGASPRMVYLVDNGAVYSFCYKVGSALYFQNFSFGTDASGEYHTVGLGAICWAPLGVNEISQIVVYTNFRTK